MKILRVIVLSACLQLTLFSIGAVPSYAQEPIPLQEQSLAAPVEPLLPGVSCGVADSTKATACCITQEDLPEDEPPGLVERVANRFGLGKISGAMKKKRELTNELNRINRDAAKNAKKCLNGEPQYKMDKGENRCTCIDTKTNDKDPVLKMCKHYLESTDNKDVETERLACVKCAQSTGYWSSFGCIPLELGDLISKLILNVGIGFGGFVAVMCVTLNAIRLQLSRGDSNKIQSVRENMTSCILGLILILFSVFILRMVDVTILGGVLGG
jgi:hypothetical protein